MSIADELERNEVIARVNALTGADKERIERALDTTLHVFADRSVLCHRLLVQRRAARSSLGVARNPAQ